MRYDVAIMGAGPAGYTAAIRLGQRGRRVALVEGETVGGTCLNWGCIPTKALFHATGAIAAAEAAAARGIRFPSPDVELDALRGSTGQTVDGLRKGVESLLDDLDVERIAGHGTLVAGGVRVEDETIEAEAVILATGSQPVEIPFLPFSEERVWSSDDAVWVPEIPERLVIIGAGVIGLEMATIYRRLGSDVVVLEMIDRLLPGVDLDRRALALLARGLSSQGISVQLDDAAKGFEAANGSATVTTVSGKRLEGDRVLVAVGRRPRTGDAGLREAGVTLEDGGRVRIDGGYRTTVDDVYAVGDIVSGPMLAHKASADALSLAAMLAGDETARVDPEGVPQAVFTAPEVASIGVSEATARERGWEILVGRCPYGALGKAQAMGHSEGIFQVVAERESGRLLGVQIVGAEAAEIIGVAAVSLQAGLDVHALAQAVQVHPTLPEGLKEAAEAALGMAIHVRNRPPRRGGA
jgi:dihydrolipoamide dehydrogenase